MSDLAKQAEELGITVDGRWTDGRLQQEIDKALAAPPEVVGTTPGPSPTSITKAEKPTAKKGEKQIDIKLKVDYWPAEDQRQEAGSVVRVPMAKAKELVAQGKAEPALSNFEDD